MEDAKFVLSKSRLLEQYNAVASITDRPLYSFKTNPVVGSLLEGLTDCGFAVHFTTAVGKIRDTSRVWFHAFALTDSGLDELIELGVGSFVVENRTDLGTLLNYIDKHDTRVNLMLRMRMKERTVRTEKHYVFGMFSKEINEIVPQIRKNGNIGELGVHFHRKTENISEWELHGEMGELLSESTLSSIDLLDMGGGLPVSYRNYRAEALPRILESIREAREWAHGHGIMTALEPGRFVSAPCIELQCRVIAIDKDTIFVNCSVYNASMDTIVDNVKLPVKGELKDGKRYLIKGCTPDSKDIFRYSVFMNEVKVGDTITFANAGAYTFASDFCGLKPLETVVVE